MNLLESLGWIAIGFAPTLVAMKLAWRMGRHETKNLLKAPEARV